MPKYFPESVGAVPVGGIIAWLKTLSGTPSLHPHFIELNGQTVSDPESVYDGVTIPDANGDNRFLRGNATSGGTGGESTHVLTEAELASHSHQVSGGRFMTTATTSNFAQQAGGLLLGTGQANTTKTAGIGTAHENKPPFLNIVWVMRIK